MLMLQNIYLLFNLSTPATIFIFVFLALLGGVVCYFTYNCLNYAFCSVLAVKGIVTKAIIRKGYLSISSALDYGFGAVSLGSSECIPCEANYVEVSAECEGEIITYRGNVDDDIFKQAKTGEILVLYKEGMLTHKPKAVGVRLAS